MELQFYPPGFAPFSDSISCDNTHWCSALTIDSLECAADGTCNSDCTEPVNFAFIQSNGVPTGPPSPQLSDLTTLTPNSRTLLMNPGDVITVRMFNAKIPGGHALEAKETDLTTGRSGVPGSDTYYTNCSGPYESSAEDPTLEPDDAPCYPFGGTHGGTAAPNLVTGCDVFTDAIGDLDWDGTPYYPDWPDSVTPDRFPSTFLQLQPTTNGGHRYPQIQFMTDASASELNTNCDINSGAGCVLPPKGPGNFYPYWTQARVAGACVWEFGNMRNGNTFGGDAQYGSVGPGTIGAFAGPIRPNPSCY